MKQSDSFSLSNPFTTTRESKVIQVFHSGHNFDDEKLIVISN